MRILQVINSMETAGAEKIVSELIPLINTNIDAKCDLLVLKSNNEFLLNELKNMENLVVHELNCGSVYNPLITFKIARIIGAYDIVHVHLFPAQYFVALAKCISFSSTRLVFTEHCVTNSRIESYFFSYINRLVYRVYNKTVCISEEIQQFYIKYTGLKQASLPLIRNGIDLKRIYSAEKVNLNDFFVTSPGVNIKFIVQVSAFRKQKDQITLIRALQYLPLNFKLILIGVGPEMNRARKVVDELSLTSRVVFLGLRNDVPSILVSSDYNVLSTKYEGMSLSCIEGMASGKPFLASDVPGVNELVNHFGVLFPLGKPKELAEKIMKLESDPRYTRDVIERCKRRASEFSIERMSSDYWNLYKAIM